MSTASSGTKVAQTTYDVGTLGTTGGPAIDPAGRVLDADGTVIRVLYAAGNVMASPMGMTYGGHGGTLGPAITFGWLAGADAAGRAGHS